MLRVRGVIVRFGNTTALDGADLDVADGSVVALLGPSGCGKSTLLRVIAGLEVPSAGTVSWNGEPVDTVPPHRRGFGLMFQDYALFPHRTVAGNVGFGLRMADLPAAEVRRRVAEVLEMVGLSGYGERPVGPLSGGEQQRVALARALAPAPRLLMLDEPIGALDRALRDRLMGELRALFTDLGITALYVTHDQEEAFTVANAVAVMERGRVVRSGPAAAVWAHPRREFVARFLGMNVVQADVADGTAATPWGTLPAPPGTEGPVMLAVRPDAIAVTAGPDGAGVPATVAGTAFRSGVYRVEAAVAGGPVLEGFSTARHEAGDPVLLTFDPEGVSLLEE
jgi:thiamine transport system ATP-binding protein